jgi:hypothetical protein
MGANNGLLKRGHAAACEPRVSTGRVNPQTRANVPLIKTRCNISTLEACQCASDQNGRCNISTNKSGGNASSGNAQNTCGVA